MSALEVLMREEVIAGGPLSCERFMELALYHPTHGYYEQTPRLIGARGDYYTSVSVGSVFGELLAFRFARWLAALGDGDCQIVEAGAHDGQIAKDILGWLQAWAPPQWAHLGYWIVEPSPRRAALQRTTLGALARRVQWFHDWAAVPAEGVRGVIFANELLDAMPLRRFVWDAPARRWLEQGVSWVNDRFDWVPLEREQGTEAGEGSTPRPWAGLLHCSIELDSVLPHGFVLETCPAAEAWWTEAARSLRAGWLVTLDYGLEAEEFLSPARAAGTLRAYRGHSVSGAVLECPGEQDLTAHVNLSAIRAAGEAAGLTSERGESQADFLLRVVAEVEDQPAGFPAWTAERRRQLATLVHPDHLGRPFRVFVQRRAEQPPERGLP